MSAVPRVSILVKALNEEVKIAQCLSAALHEAAQVDGEVILIDSLSIDRTVAIAQQFPVRIVQFDRAADRGCGAAVQLGFQFARAEFVYVLDADMVLQPGFLPAALARLQASPGLAGVGGKLLDLEVRTASDRQRLATAETQAADQAAAELGGGGLYRVAALSQTGYLAHRWLAAYEEAELGARLRQGGWGLLRLAMPAVVHHGHAEHNAQMMLRLWRNGRARASGTLLRAALGKPWFGRLARKQAFLLFVPGLHGLAWGAAALSGGGTAVKLAAWGSVWLAAWLVLAWRKGGPAAGAWTLLLWHFFTLAAVLGFWRPVADPLLPVAGHELDPPASVPGLHPPHNTPQPQSPGGQGY